MKHLIFFQVDIYRVGNYNSTAGGLNLPNDMFFFFRKKH